MAAKLWGKVYFGDTFAGMLEQQPGGRVAFSYDTTYLESGFPPIAFTLPLREAPHLCEAGLHPFFDNLVAEGWLRQVQARALGVNRDDRFALLITFGLDCAGAVSIVDPEPVRDLKVDMDDPEAVAALAARASLSGIQPKLFVVREGRRYRPARIGEASTHIAKLPSGHLPGIVEIEWLTTLACRALLPGEPIVEMTLGKIGNVASDALLVRRFDRTSSGEKLHFEEFNQLLGQRSEEKYDGAYESMARFINSTPGCIPLEAERLYRRVLACILTGNTDAHLKNFAMFHTGEGLRLAPAYDLVAASLYKDYQTVALSLGGAENLRIGRVQPKHIIALGEGFGLRRGAIDLAVRDLAKVREAARDAVADSKFGHSGHRDGLIELMESRWNGTFASIGSLLSKKPDIGAKPKASLKGGSRKSPA